MSSDLVKRGLELFNDQIELPNERKAKEKKSRKVKDGMRLINSNKHGVWKQLRQLHVEQAHDTKKKKLLKKTKSRLEEYKDNQEKDHTKSNVKIFKQISSVGKIKSVYSKKIIEQHQRKLSKDMPKEMNEESDTVFTDRDFDKFEEEYDFFQKLQ
ncbi:hypothetical protein LOTGIDRAFT_228955 [Lottia gigantea]|uniref:Active regulator of SIRT1 n=1 Tax=Lottia gigantea TaxID=225164 RepID=V4A6W7_LOTGI|nr:hypothetical protein LOTGIDRAFT_228955 [Lottia gigantea]ESO89011.1 hypothetical protein LOTGIDRAFT_228955 [Lottia gigantea]